MTSCPACADFAQNPHTHSFNSACLECQARSIAQSPLYFSAAADKSKRVQYRDFIVSKLGLAYEAAHERVKHYAQLLKQAKEIA